MRTNIGRKENTTANQNFDLLALHRLPWKLYFSWGFRQHRCQAGSTNLSYRSYLTSTLLSGRVVHPRHQKLAAIDTVHIEASARLGVLEKLASITRIRTCPVNPSACSCSFQRIRCIALEVGCSVRIGCSPHKQTCHVDNHPVHSKVCWSGMTCSLDLWSLLDICAAESLN